mgnify:CR=1 FL=1
MSHYDLAIIGGGINGVGIARDAAGRGLKVYLCEQNDLASATSSASTKLIHGGLRYLEHYKFRLVAESLAEREVLLQMAPHIAWPLRFVLPHEPGIRPRWLIRLGLFLYDHLGGRKLLPGTRTLNLKEDAAGKPLKPQFTTAFEYSDCWVNDARLVVLNAMDARDHGATIETHTRCVSAAAADGAWSLQLEDAAGTHEITATALVNAGGPWVVDCIKDVIHTETGEGVRLVRGSHVVVRKIFEHDRPYIFQNRDGRIIFAIPYEDDFTLLGTTDLDHKGAPADAHCSDEEVEYICVAASDYFAKEIKAEDVVWTYSGVRPLYDDGASAAQEATRDYVLKLRDVKGSALLNVFGGKITTYRRLAEHALRDLEPHLPMQGEWTRGASLPGGDIPWAVLEAVQQKLSEDYSFIPADTMKRISKCYGTRARQWLGESSKLEDLGQHFGAGLYQTEVDYLVAEEWAVEVEDIIWRRTKLGLRLSEAEVQVLRDYLSNSASTDNAEST